MQNSNATLVVPPTVNRGVPHVDPIESKLRRLRGIEAEQLATVATLAAAGDIAGTIDAASRLLGIHAEVAETEARLAHPSSGTRTDETDARIGDPAFKAA